MRSALAMARRGLGETWPNPAVGCVLVDRAGRLIARGRTQAGGRPHAEAAALEAARETGQSSRLEAATAYVTLEPCAHHGRTPPCAGALVEARVRRVVVAIEDPDPRVSGRGFAILRDAGLEVTTGVGRAEAEELLAGYLLRQREGRPRLTLKLAATLDGRIATATGESRWISGSEARDRAHLLRARSDAILIGAGTARLDDPMLDVRLPGLETRRPVRAILDARLSTPLDGKLAQTARTQPVWLLSRAFGEDAGARRAAWVEAGADVIDAAAGADARRGLDPLEALRALGARGVGEALCEGGGRLAASLLRAGLVDRLIWISAGAAIGADGAPALGGLEVGPLAAAPRFDLARWERVGSDLWSEWTPAAGPR